MSSILHNKIDTEAADPALEQSPDPESKTTISITEEKRQQKRRATDHSPETCHKLLDVQTAMANVNAKLAEVKTRLDAGAVRLNDGSHRMGRIENSVETVTEIIQRGAASHARVEEKLNEQCTVTQLNAVALRELQDAQTTSNSIQASIAAQGRNNASAIDDLIAALGRINADLAKLLAILEAAEGFFKVANWLAKAIKPLAIIVASIISVYVSIKGMGGTK